MFKLEDYPPHVQEAITALKLVDRALERARRGAVWLDKHAPPHWRLNMISIHDGKVTSHVRICRDDENPLALAYRDTGPLSRISGRVTWASILTQVTEFKRDHHAQEHGFLETYYTDPTSHVYVDKQIDGQLLDHAWAQVLSELEWHPRMGSSSQRYVA